MLNPITLTATKPMHTSMIPRYDHKAIHSAKRRLTDMIGLPSLAAFVSSHGGWMLSNLAKVLPAELARLTSGGTPAAASTTTTTPVKQTIRLGAAAPATPTTPSPAPAPSKTHQFIPAKPATPPAKPRASGTVPDGAITLNQARQRTAQIFGYTPGFTPSQNAKSQWRDLEQVYRAAGFRAPWSDSFSKVDSSLAKLNSSLYAKREAAIKKLFPQN